jgi:hypothetical protein
LKAVVALGSILLAGAVRLDGSERLHIRAAARTTSDIVIYVGVERREENRMLRVTAESSDFYRSSEVQLDGEASPRVNVFTFHQVPSGEYDVKAELIISNGHTGSVARCSVLVF